MITPEELRDLVLYRKELLLPTTEKKKFGSAIMLLTPNYESTKNMMNLPYITDKFKSYESYYMEKNVMRYINTEGKLEADNNEDEYLHEVSESVLVLQEAAKKHFYFYHLIPKGSDISKGVFSLKYYYKNDIKLFRKYSDKYRDRLCNGWGIYPGRDPNSLSDEEVYKGICKFRKDDDGVNKIYLFRYAPHKGLGKQMGKTIDGKDIYMIDLADPEVLKYIKSVDWGYDMSSTDNAPLDRDYYENITSEEYFSRYKDEGVIFSYLNHIGITPKDGYIPKKFWKKVNSSSHIQESSNILLEENIQVDRDIMEKACVDAVHGLNWCTMDDGAFCDINTATIIGDNYFSCGCFNPRCPEGSKQKIMNFLHRNKTWVFDNDIRYNIEWEVREIDGREYAVGTITSMEAPTVHESTNLFSIGENQLSSKERKELDASDYGLPDKRKYPMPDAAHVQSAIRFFNYVSEDDEPELARNIIKKAKKFNVPIRCGKKNRLSKYLTEETAYEGFVSEDMYGVINGTIKQHIAQMNNPDQYDYVKSTQYPFTKRKKKVKKVIQERVSKKCTCGSNNVGVFFRGEPVYICKDCGKYLGVVPFHSNKKKKAANENEEEEEPSTPINRVALACQDLIDLFDKKLDIKYDIVSIYPEEQGIVFAKAYDGESATAIKNYLNMNLQSMNPEYTVDFINTTGDDIHQLGDYYIYVTYDGYKGISGIITNNMGNNIF